MPIWLVGVNEFKFVLIDHKFQHMINIVNELDMLEKTHDILIVYIHITGQFLDFFLLNTTGQNLSIEAHYLTLQGTHFFLSSLEIHLKLIIFLSHIYLTAKIRVRVFNVTFNNICYMVVASFKITTVVEIGADCTGSRKCNYYTITLQWPN